MIKEKKNTVTVEGRRRGGSRRAFFCPYFHVSKEHICVGAVDDSAVEERDSDSAVSADCR